MNPNSDYYNYAFRHMEILSTMLRQLDNINSNMTSLYNVNNSTTRMTRPYSSARPYTATRTPATTRMSTNTRATTNTTTNPPVDNQLSNLANNILTSIFWDPVAVYPTEQEIEDATTLINFNELPEGSSRCPITLEPFTEDSQILRIDACGHVFTRSGIRRWFRNHVNCPVCRHDIRSGNTNENNSQLNNIQTENNDTHTLQFDFTLNPNLSSNGNYMTFPLPPNFGSRSGNNNQNSDI